jgi:phage gp36-like protein
MPYFTQEQLSALIPEGWLTDGLDDDNDGSAEMFDGVRSMAEARINSVLGMRYAVPFTNPSAALAEFLVDIGCHLAAKIVYARRQQADKFPYAKELDELWQRLNRIGSGNDPLSPKIEQENEHTAIISETSKVYSRNSGF